MYSHHGIPQLLTRILVRSLGSSTDSYLSGCIDVFAHMVDTVPTGVTLTDPIVPNAVKPVDISLTLDANGNIVFSGYIRVISD